MVSSNTINDIKRSTDLLIKYANNNVDFSYNFINNILSCIEVIIVNKDKFISDDLIIVKNCFEIINKILKAKLDKDLESLNI